MKPILTVSNLSKDFVKPLDFFAKFLNRLGQDHTAEVVHAVEDGPVMELPGHRKQFALANSPASPSLLSPTRHKY